MISRDKLRVRSKATEFQPILPISISCCIWSMVHTGIQRYTWEQVNTSDQRLNSVNLKVAIATLVYGTKVKHYAGKVSVNY